ncbi:hypothetical protein C4J89_2879 [Pseudomonas sp. R4-35-07]|nr:hypothetical protein C4J91_2945 [Pseudomonas sp. R3-52-08]AZF32354.1 hypothetical protein C4J89_2879 [Pseudomonas sp. R4-35-07]
MHAFLHKQLSEKTCQISDLRSLPDYSHGMGPTQEQAL